MARYRHLNGVTVTVPDDRDMGPEWESVKGSTTTEKKSAPRRSTTTKKSDEK